MAMTYATLTAAKGQSGSLANWVGYSAAKLDVATILDEAQSLLYSLLRVREMRTVWTFGLAENESSIALPSRFLDPIGRIRSTNGCVFIHRAESEIEDSRAFEQRDGDFAADPFTTVIGSSLVSVALVDHDFTQNSIITIDDASDVGGLNLSGTFPIVSLTSDSVFVIDAGSEATSSATGGGSLADYTIQRLVDAAPSIWSIYDEKLQFDLATDTDLQMRLLYYRAPPMLSGSYTHNWLTDRYPRFLRQACIASCHEFMQEDASYQAALAVLNAMIAEMRVQDDLSYRGAEIFMETPDGG